MPRPARPWFRFYVEALSDRKLRRLTPAQRWLWVAVLGAARQSPRPGWLLVSLDEPMHAQDLADLAGVNVREVERTIPLLERMDMLAVSEGCWVVVNWCDRQYESDDATERVRKHRALKRSNAVTETAVVTPPETETETESELLPLPPLLSVVPFAAKPPKAELRQALKQGLSNG